MKNNQKGDDIVTTFLSGCMFLIFMLFLIGGIAGVFFK